MRKILHNLSFCIFALLPVMLAAGCQAQVDQPGLPAVEAAAPAAPAVVEQTPEPLASLSVVSQEEHPALMDTNDADKFFPNRAVTRLELCRYLHPMLEGYPAGKAGFTDLKSGDEGYDQAAELCGAGLLTDLIQRGMLSPYKSLTRPALVNVLLRLSQRVSGEDAQRVKALVEDVSMGLTSEAGESQGMQEPILRQELAVVLMRLAGREPDETALFLGQHIPADVTTDSYGWANIADAVTEGRVPPMAPGIHRAYNWLYATWDDGTLITDMDYGVWTFGLDGRYTTGNEELDGYLAEILETIGAMDLSTEEALKAAYLYVKYNFEYMVRPEDMDAIPNEQTGWEFDRGVRFFRYGGGTCYGFAAGFGLLARALGQNAYIVAAEVNEFHAPHGFVVIPDDGMDWIYDVELEATRMERHADLDLFDIKNYTIYNYWYRPDWAQG